MVCNCEFSQKGDLPAPARAPGDRPRSEWGRRPSLTEERTPSAAPRRKGADAAKMHGSVRLVVQDERPGTLALFLGDSQLQTSCPRRSEWGAGAARVHGSVSPLAQDGRRRETCIIPREFAVANLVCPRRSEWGRRPSSTDERAPSATPLAGRVPVRPRGAVLCAWLSRTGARGNLHYLSRIRSCKPHVPVANQLQTQLQTCFSARIPKANVPLEIDSCKPKLVERFDKKELIEFHSNGAA